MMRVVQRGPEGGDHPHAQPLEDDEQRQPAPAYLDVRAPDGQIPEADEPRGMQGHDQRIVAGRGLARTLGKQALGVAPGQDKLAETLQGHQAEDGPRQDHHAAWASDRQVQVKPGPSAVSTVRLGRPCFASRSSTNRTVGADMLPYSSSTARS